MLTDPPVADDDSHDRCGGCTEAHELCHRETKEGPVPAAAEGFQKTPLNAVPDEVEQADVAGDEQAAAGGKAAPQEEQHADADQAQHRLVEEERDEVCIGRSS